MTASTITKRITLVAVGTVIATLGTVDPSQALSVVTSRSSLGANNSVSWSSLGAEYTPISNPFSVGSAGGNAITGSIPTGTFQRLNERSGWFGNFAEGDALLFTGFNSGPLSFTFVNSVFGAGAQIQSNAYGLFTATIEAFNNSGLSLGSFSLQGNSSSGPDNSAIFIGVLNDQADIARITFNISNSNSVDFAINQLDLKSGTTAVPTPALLPGLIGLGFGVLRKRKVEATKQTSEV